jgi:hypothetical protein
MATRSPRLRWNVSKPGPTCSTSLSTPSVPLVHKMKPASSPPFAAQGIHKASSNRPFAISRNSLGARLSANPAASDAVVPSVTREHRPRLRLEVPETLDGKVERLVATQKQTHCGTLLCLAAPQYARIDARPRSCWHRLQGLQ